MSQKKIMILGIDGYLGWSLALALGASGYDISGVDNYSRRLWVKERGGHTIVPISRMTERLHLAQDVLGIRIYFREMDILNRNVLKEFMDEVKPDVVVHYAECPSAPFSMIDYDHASRVQNNNVIGTLAVLFSMHEVIPDATLIKLGTMGEYGTPASGRPLFEGFFPEDAYLLWRGKQWSLKGEITPREPGSFYHVSKVQDSINVHAACRFWGLKSYDVMQGIIYGVHTDQVAADERLRTRLDMDECFGTVINRFVCQAVIGHPLTIFGPGEHIRGFIALEDAMQCMQRLIERPLEKGEYAVINQMSDYYSMNDLAAIVAQVAQEEFGIYCDIQHIEDPRVESLHHQFYPIYEKLPQQFGFQSTTSLQTEIRRMFQLLNQIDIQKRIEEKKHLILPRTWWSGEKKIACAYQEETT